MDPDLVRQQEEEEAAHRLRPVVTAQAPFIRADKEDEKFVLRAEPLENFQAPEPALQAQPAKPLPGWGGALRATVYCLALATLGLLAGNRLGDWLGLVFWQSIALGMGMALLFGWQAAASLLRKRYEVSRARAYRASLLPALIIMISLVAAFAIVLPFAGSALEAGESRQLLLPWLISLSVGAALGLVLAVPRMHAGLRS